jgi:MarR family transcriptional regulator, organic hydroperoxide resistance regulator
MKPDPAREAWQIAFGLAMANRGRLLESLEELDLTFMQAYVLRLLEVAKPMPMGDLAGLLHCDASNVTGIVDRLEARGLVQRGSAPHDRRVKALVLTPAGLQLRGRALRSMTEPPEAIRRLSAPDQRALRDILRRAVPESGMMEA